MGRTLVLLLLLNYYSGNALENSPYVDLNVTFCVDHKNLVGWYLRKETCTNLVSWCAFYEGVRSQATVFQPASQSVSSGETVQLSCSRSGSGNWDSDFSWYQQQPGKAPRFVYYTSGTRGSGIPDRFTASKSGTVSHLTINNLQAEDEADYFCADWYSTGSRSHSDTN